MALIEKEEVCDLVAEGIIKGGNTLFHFFIFILYNVQLYKKNCAILLLCWAVRP